MWKYTLCIRVHKGISMNRDPNYISLFNMNGKSKVGNQSY